MSNPITYKDLKKGDRIKVEIVGEIDGAGDLVDNPEALSWYVSADIISQAKITLLEPKLKVGRAEHMPSGEKGQVICIDGEYAWFRFYGDLDPGTELVSNLRNIPEDTDG